MAYFKNGDILYLSVSDEKESNSVEMSPDVTAEFRGLWGRP